jgi:hypothetical protein
MEKKHSQSYAAGVDIIGQRLAGDEGDAKGEDCGSLHFDIGRWGTRMELIDGRIEPRVMQAIRSWKTGIRGVAEERERSRSGGGRVRR